jgi:hypothetical protein
MSYENIINDSLDIYAEIKQMEQNNPNYFKKRKIKKYKAQLLDSINKLYKANMPLSADILYSLATNIYNNYIPEGRFGCITRIIYSEINLDYILYIEIGDCSYIITIGFEKPNIKIEILIDKYKISRYRFTSKTISTLNKDIKEYVDLLNITLIHTIADYLLEFINREENSNEI